MHAETDFPFHQPGYIFAVIFINVSSTGTKSPQIIRMNRNVIAGSEATKQSGRAFTSLDYVARRFAGRSQ
jgi:hypothetical protein